MCVKCGKLVQQLRQLSRSENYFCMSEPFKTPGGQKKKEERIRTRDFVSRAPGAAISDHLGGLDPSFSWKPMNANISFGITRVKGLHNKVTVFSTSICICPLKIPAVYRTSRDRICRYLVLVGCSANLPLCQLSRATA